MPPQKRYQSNRSTMSPSNRCHTSPTARHTHATNDQQPAVSPRKIFVPKTSIQSYRQQVTRVTSYCRCSVAPAKTVQIRCVLRRNDRIIIFQNRVLSRTSYLAAVNSPACTKVSWNSMHQQWVPRLQPRFQLPSKRCTMNIAKKIERNFCEKPVSWSSCHIIASSNWLASQRWALYSLTRTVSAILDSTINWFSGSTIDDCARISGAWFVIQLSAGK